MDTDCLAVPKELIKVPANLKYIKLSDSVMILGTARM
jgi:hypothetical protein